MSHTFHTGEVNELLDRYKVGELTLDELAQSFRTHRWPRRESPPRPKTYMELAARSLQDPDSSVTDSFDDVEAAFFRHDLSIEDYVLLREAMHDAIKAEDRGEL